MDLGKKKDHVLLVAHTLFKTYGFQYVGVDRIISESKVAKMTFYNNFLSKNNLMLAVVEREISDQKTALQSIVSGNGSQVKQIEKLFLWHLGIIENENYSGCLLNKALVELWRDIEVVKLIEDFNKWKFKLVLNLLNEDKKDKAVIIFNLLNAMLLPANQNIIKWADLEKLIV
ncbi:TetR family transcriptional regulator [Acinetobacter baumannii]|uniref:TetR/AcrR family transcriptional regulator n=1 Tax=Acinetobacter baumannii TaxID=470 RepID=UPI00387DC0E0